MTFTDLYLRADTQEELDAALAQAGIVQGTPGAMFDRLPIPFHRLVGYEQDGEPILATFDECHVNVRLAWEPSDEQQAVLAPFLVVPPNTPFRRWAS